MVVRTDFRSAPGDMGAPYNPMLTESATIRLDLPLTSGSTVAGELVDKLDGLMTRS